MSVESTVLITRKKAIEKLRMQLAVLMGSLESKSDEELEDILYANRDFIFENFRIVNEEQTEEGNEG